MSESYNNQNRPQLWPQRKKHEPKNWKTLVNKQFPGLMKQVVIGELYIPPGLATIIAAYAAMKYNDAPIIEPCSACGSVTRACARFLTNPDSAIQPPCGYSLMNNHLWEVPARELMTITVSEMRLWPYDCELSDKKEDIMLHNRSCGQGCRILQRRMITITDQHEVAK